jgi:hypothetical protein
VGAASSRDLHEEPNRNSAIWQHMKYSNQFQIYAVGKANIVCAGRIKSLI